MSNNPELILVEGLSGSGKTTLANMLCNRYGYAPDNTGVVCRAVSAAAILGGVSSHEQPEFSLEAHLDADMADGLPQLAVNGRDVSDYLQRPDAAKLATKVRLDQEVEQRLEKIFDSFVGGATRAVVEGKHIGTRFCSESRFFLTATQEVRAYRKWLQALRSGRKDYSWPEAYADFLEGETRDRKAGILVSGTNTNIIDTTHLSPEAVLARVLAAGRE
jgi:cytidylate kinase